MTVRDFVVAVATRLLVWSLNAVIVMWMWNEAVVPLIDAHRASWVQALGLVLLVQFLRPVDAPSPRKKTP